LKALTASACISPETSQRLHTRHLLFHRSSPLANRQSHHVNRLDQFLHLCRQNPASCRLGCYTRSIPRHRHPSRLFPIPYLPAIRQRLRPRAHHRAHQTIQDWYRRLSNMEARLAGQSAILRRCFHASEASRQILIDLDDRREMYTTTVGDTTQSSGHPKRCSWRPRGDILATITG